jgi:hypothetical protein
MADPTPGASVKYPWQQAMLDAFIELDAEALALKVSAAERVIAERLREIDQLDIEEHTALRDALRTLHILMPRRSDSETPRVEKERIA